jgi:hypothetical protein
MNTNKPARWFRMYAEFASDPKVQMLSECYQRRYMMLLCLRCSNGDVTLQDTEVAFQLRIDVTEWEKTKGVLAEKNLINKHNQPTAWDKRQFASDSSAERVAKHRANKKEQCNVTVTPPEKEKEKETKKENKTNAEALDGFDEFWAIYEKKGNKMQSQKAWKKLKPSIELQLEIYAQARLYVQATPDKQFRKDASTWLNNHCWKDVLNPAKPKPKGFFAQLGMIGENHEQSQPPIALGLDR